MRKRGGASGTCSFDGARVAGCPVHWWACVQRLCSPKVASAWKERERRGARARVSAFARDDHMRSQLRSLARAFEPRPVQMQA